MFEKFREETSKVETQDVLNFGIDQYKIAIEVRKGNIIFQDASGRDQEINKGDAVRIWVENPMAKNTAKKVIGPTMRAEGVLQSVGATFAVVKYGEKTLTIPTKEFLHDQIQKIEETRRKDARLEEQARAESMIKPSIQAKEKNAREMDEKEKINIAKKLGVDVNEPGWQEKMDQQIRKITGA